MGWTRSRGIAELLRGPRTAYLQKPVDVHQLEGRIVELLKS